MARIKHTRTRRAWRSALAGLLLGLACNTPSIPIPPPAPERMQFEVEVNAEVATFQYDPDEIYGGATVYVFNADRGVGVIDTARADGSVGPTSPFPGLPGDRIEVTAQTDEQLATTCVYLAGGRSSEANRCQ